MFRSLKHASLFGKVHYLPYGKLCRFKKIIKHTSLFSQDDSQNYINFGEKNLIIKHISLLGSVKYNTKVKLSQNPEHDSFFKVLIYKQNILGWNL